MTARPIFIGGTASNAGKSWMTTALCAWLRARGVAVAPFKAQNMSNNSYPCAAGGEIGRAQVAQAEACGVEPEPCMNPILLKPSGDGACQVVVMGQVWKRLRAQDYYACVPTLRETVLDAYRSLASRFDVVVIEGAGSVSELNLRPHDLVNLNLVTTIDAPWLLVADIERGGVFASILGTFGLLTPAERALCRGFLINKFRGDRSLFEDGVSLLEARTGATCFGVFPYDETIQIDPEDSLALETRRREPASAGATIAIVRLPHLSNATDFRLLTWSDWITAVPSGHYDFIVIPGSKSTIADMRWLRSSGLADWIRAQYACGATVIGICGGYQMLGEAIADPDRVESVYEYTAGLGLIHATTVLTTDKRTRTVVARLESGATFGAYEIHMGVTTLEPSVATRPFAIVNDRTADGICHNRVIGTYLHGALEHPEVCEVLFGVRPPAVAEKAEHYRRLGLWFEAHQRNVGDLGLV